MEDRRIRKTKKAFYSALIELLKGKELKDIGIQELCDLADSHRSTFYYHYSDIYALYDELENKILKEYYSLWVTDEPHTYYSVYENIITYFYNNRNVWTVLLGNNGKPSFKKNVSDLLEKKYIDIWKYEMGRDTFPEEFYLLTASNIAAFIKLFSEWMADNCSYPADKLKQLLSEMDASFDALIEKYL